MKGDNKNSKLWWWNLSEDEILELIEVWLSKECHSILPFFKDIVLYDTDTGYGTTMRTNEQKIHGYKTLQSTIKHHRYIEKEQTRYFKK